MFDGAAQLRRLIDRPGLARFVGAHNALGAKVAERAGFDGVWSGSCEISVRKDIALHNSGFSRLTRAKMDELIAETGLAVLDHDELILFHSNLVALRRA